MYYIINKSTGKYLTRDSGKTSVSAQTKANSNRQLWEVTKVGGVYQIKNINSSQYLGSPNGQPFSKNASPVIRTVAQKWRIVKNPGSGTYRIFAQNSQYSLENNSSLQSGTLVRATDFTTSDTRKWEFVAAVDQVAVKWPKTSEATGCTAWRLWSGFLRLFRNNSRCSFHYTAENNISPTPRAAH